MNTQQKLPQELKMFESFFNGQNLNKSNLHSVFFVEEDHMTFGSPNKFDGKKNFPKNCLGAKKYFVAEFWFEYPEEIRLPQNYFVFTHVFQLDLIQLKIELNKMGENDALSDPEDVAVIIKNNYDSLKYLLLGECDYELFAAIIIEKKNQPSKEKYGL